MLYNTFSNKEAALLSEPKCTDENNSFSLLHLLTRLILQSQVRSGSYRLSSVDKIEFCCLMDKKKTSKPQTTMHLVTVERFGNKIWYSCETVLLQQSPELLTVRCLS